LKPPASSPKLDLAVRVGARMKPVLAASLLVLLFSGAAEADGYQDFNLGLVSRNRQDWDATVKLMTLALSEPDLPPHLKVVAYFDRGTSYLGEKQFDAAIADFTTVIQLKPDYIEAYSARASAFAAKTQFAKAIDDITKAISLRPVYRPTYYQRIAIYTATKNMEAAIADCTTLIKMSPNEAMLYRLRGTTYRRNGNYDLAIADEGTALAINDQVAVDFRERGFDYAAKGDFSNAVDDFNSEIRLSVDLTLPYMRKGAVQWDWGKFADAESSFEHALKIQPQQKYGFLWLAITRGKTSTAIDSDMSQRFSASDLTKWPGPLVALFLGKATAGDVDSAAKRADAASQIGEICEAQFFIAEWQQIHQLADDAVIRPAAIAESNRPVAP